MDCYGLEFSLKLIESAVRVVDRSCGPYCMLMTIYLDYFYCISDGYLAECFPLYVDDPIVGRRRERISD